MEINLNKISMNKETYELFTKVFNKLEEILLAEMHENLGKTDDHVCLFRFTTNRINDELSITIDDCCYYPSYGYDPFDLEVKLEEPKEFEMSQ